MQYPVQIKHFPGNIGNTLNYESMGNSYSLNKFESTSTNETNDSRKNLLVNHPNHETSFNNANQSTVVDPVNCVNCPIPNDGVDAELTVIDETIRK